MLLALWPLFMQPAQAAPIRPSYSVGGIKHQSRKRRRILPDEEVDLKLLQFAEDVSTPLHSARPRAVRLREEELLA